MLSLESAPGTTTDGKALAANSAAPACANVLSRLHQMSQKGWPGLLLAAAGLRRLGLTDRITRVLAPKGVLALARPRNARGANPHRSRRHLAPGAVVDRARWGHRRCRAC
ncbi:hypothetical protein [Nocardiopsis sp. CNS-639]|uniref:hypothetical protein n=1 Tax=Nocardiopsis sp. CNS-639 TaxID=1169153 RepID=UPI0012DE233A